MDRSEWHDTRIDGLKKPADILAQEAEDAVRQERKVRMMTMPRECSNCDNKEELTFFDDIQGLPAYLCPDCLRHFGLDGDGNQTEAMLAAKRAKPKARLDGTMAKLGVAEHEWRVDIESFFVDADDEEAAWKAAKTYLETHTMRIDQIELNE